jgi:hypothetical protein
MNKNYIGREIFCLIPLGMIIFALLTQLTASGGETDEMARLKSIQKHHEEAVMSIEGVVGMGIGQGDDGKPPQFEIYVRKYTPELEQKIPKSLDGVRVRIVETGEFRAL